MYHYLSCHYDNEASILAALLDDAACLQWWQAQGVNSLPPVGQLTMQSALVSPKPLDSMKMTPNAPIQILLVEDNEPDVILTQEAFLDAGLPINLQVARDGVEALQILRREDGFAGAPRPDVILLDINMPRKNGLEVLAELKADGDLRTIPVVVLTTSQAEEDILRSYQSHASSYIVKPVEFAQFYSAIQALGQYMLGTVRLPPHS